MVEMPGWVIGVWTIMMGVFSAGAAWGGNRYAHRQTEQSIKELKRDVRTLTERLTSDEKEYVKQTECIREQTEMTKDLEAIRLQVQTGFSKIENLLSSMDTKREDSKMDMTDRLARVEQACRWMETRVS